MAIKFSVAVRNAMLDAIETAIGASAILRIRTGAMPANIGDAAAGTLLAEMALPADWMAAAANGSKGLAGTWQDASGNADGAAGHYEIMASDGTTRHTMGTVTGTGGGGDMELNNVNIATGQEVNITSFSWTAPNAG